MAGESYVMYIHLESTYSFIRWLARERLRSEEQKT